ncbi:TIGR02679 domain-containing protein [Marinilactibacillus kalidii]|uniref:TIGR02679 domain-containing protein n=1 Tax=Marinilactibacillus kalidii TaxID=2820274 RepID=UPI001ABE9E78|nr:TIGR02679 domain-containing protein [Marinilactibacillus kalidii]
MAKQDSLKKALNYFKKSDIFFHLFLLFKNEYDTTKKPIKFIDISEFTEEELEPVKAFLMTDLDLSQQPVVVDTSRFEARLQITFGLTLPLEAFLTVFFQDMLKIEEPDMQQPHREMSNFVDYLEREYGLLAGWFSYLRRGTSDSQWVYHLISASPKAFEDHVLHLSEAVRLLPERPIRLGLFGQIVAGDPHAFDRHTTLGKLFLHVLSEDARYHAIEPVKVPSSSEEVNQLLLKFNLLRDDITNYTTAVNLYAETIEGYHPVWESAAHLHNVLNVPMRELINIVAAYPAHEAQIVWVIENPVVFSTILDEVPNVPMICTQGQLTLATMELLDRLAEEETDIRYCGDMTPEGIQRAEKILMRYPESSQPWKMDIPSYLASRAEEETLDAKDIETLNAFSLDIFSCLKDEMKDRGNPAYQEMLIEEMISELNYYYQ